MNLAAAHGKMHYAWWPEWHGECVAIIASGPSVKGLEVTLLRDRIHVIAIKTAIDLCPWAEVCYGCDAAWWLDRKGLPKYSGIKLFHGITAANRWPDVHRVEIEFVDRMLVDRPLKVGNGGNSGFQALNLAIQFGATDIILIGFDCHSRGDMHWYGRNKWPNANNPAPSNFNRWMKGFENAKHDLNKMGITVINTSMQSEIKSFRKMPLDEVMKTWGL